MSRSGLLLVALAAVVTMAANLLLRAGIDRAGGFQPSSLAAVPAGFVRLLTQPAFAAGFLAYFLAALVWFRVVASEPLSVAYPVLVSATFLLVTTGSVVLLEEALSTQKVVGLTLIVLGIVIAARG